MQVRGTSPDGKHDRVLIIEPQVGAQNFEVSISVPGKMTGYKALIPKSELLRAFMLLVIETIRVSPELVAIWMKQQFRRHQELAVLSQAGCPVCRSKRGYGLDSAATDTFERCLECGAPKPPDVLVDEVVGKLLLHKI